MNKVKSILVAASGIVTNHFYEIIFPRNWCHCFCNVVADVSPCFCGLNPGKKFSISSLLHKHFLFISKLPNFIIIDSKERSPAAGDHAWVCHSDETILIIRFEKYSSFKVRVRRIPAINPFHFVHQSLHFRRICHELR
jgi:hypothetical protein